MWENSLLFCAVPGMVIVFVHSEDRDCGSRMSAIALLIEMSKSADKSTGVLLTNNLIISVAICQRMKE
jgi:hypothetical protein